MSMSRNLIKKRNIKKRGTFKQRGIGTGIIKKNKKNTYTLDVPHNFCLSFSTVRRFFFDVSVSFWPVFVFELLKYSFYSAGWPKKDNKSNHELTASHAFSVANTDCIIERKKQGRRRGCKHVWGGGVRRMGGVRERSKQKLSFMQMTHDSNVSWI